MICFVSLQASSGLLRVSLCLGVVVGSLIVMPVFDKPLLAAPTTVPLTSICEIDRAYPTPHACQIMGDRVFPCTRILEQSYRCYGSKCVNNSVEPDEDTIKLFDIETRWFRCNPPKEDGQLLRGYRMYCEMHSKDAGSCNLKEEKCGYEACLPKKVYVPEAVRTTSGWMSQGCTSLFKRFDEDNHPNRLRPDEVLSYHQDIVEDIHFESDLEYLLAELEEVEADGIISTNGSTEDDEDTLCSES